MNQRKVLPARQPHKRTAHNTYIFLVDLLRLAVVDTGNAPAAQVGRRRTGVSAPVNGEARHTRLVGQDIAEQLRDVDRIGEVLGLERLRILVVHVISDLHELVVHERAGDQNDCHADKVLVGYTLWFGGIRLQYESVDSNRDRSHHDLFQNLVS